MNTFDPDASGEFACSLHMVDVATGWSEIAAILGKSQVVVADAFSRILSRLPFPVLQLHPDNGSELLNHRLLRLWQEWLPGLTWSRSRPYEKRRLYSDCLQPVMRLADKHFLPLEGGGSRLRRSYACSATLSLGHDPTGPPACQQPA